MANFIGCMLLQRILWPSIIVACAFMRPTGISFVYLLMFFISPFIPVATPKNIRGSVGAYFIVWIALTSLLILLHIGLQIAVLVLGFENIIGKCSFLEILLRHIGFIHLMNLQPLAIAEWVVPEVLAFAASVILYVILKKIVVDTNEEEEVTDVVVRDGNVEEGFRQLRANKEDTIASSVIEKLQLIGPYISLAAIFLAAVLRPSVPGGLYFLIFLGGGTYWACYKSFGRAFRIVLQILLVIIVAHSIAIFTYQTPWPQQFLANSSLPARLSGLEPLFISSCTKGDDIRVISFNDSVYFDSYLNPIAILLCYYILALTCKSPVSKTEFTQDESTTEIPTENTPLVRRSTRSKKTPKTENIAMGSMSDETTEAEVRPTVLDEVILGLQSCGNFLYINSYIFTSIIMMVWSIVYHSWLTFVLLIWANALWMIPNQRKTMLRSSPFIVFYAELLLIAQYIYGMDLTDEELPSSVEVQAVNLRQIGFVKPAKYPCAPLMLKTFFILMFWSTMRQLFREQLEKRRSATLANIVAPLQLSVGAATAGLSSETAERKTRFIDKVGEVFKSLLVKLWIWLLVFVIFLCGITGHRMTGFRICYMALFLFFVLAFQLSWRSWTKIMYGYWLVLIVYAMTILILIYTYQFDQFNTYWEKYIGISDTLQKDIGLEKYKTKDLFLHLFNPTLIVVMTVLQVHYFHAKFLESLIKQEVEEVLPNTREEAGEESKQDESPSDGLDKENGDPQKYSLFRRISRRRIEQIVTTTRAAGKQILEYVWIFAELHLMKVIMVVAFWCCLANVCVLHIGFAFLAVIAVVSRMKVQIFISRVISVQMSILLLAKMIYQVDYINHKNYDAICDENSTVSLIYINNAEWFGLSKITESIGLATLVKGYIIYMIVVTLHAVVIFRQGYRRSWLGLENKSPPVMFEGVKRMDAEADLVGLFKFLLNYGYYKFGFEISLIALVSVISYRQDILAILYVMWLCILFKLRRSSSAKLWPSFQFFVAIVIILEYVLFVGLPPGLCMEWPWYNSPYLNGLQSWAMVPGPHLHKQTTKLMFDFILLMFIYRQQRVFTLEKKFIDSNIEYPAGTNKSIVNDIDNLDVTPLDNPVPDFISNVRNWLDILKIAVLNGCFWVTLAVVFLAGTNTISIFSIGYLIGSFIFLWQGTDFYLRPVRSILKWWYVLMGYNVIVISIKTIMQIAGCLFLNTLEQHACWFVHLFGVSCIHDTIAETMGGMKTPMHECQEILDDTGLTWDAVCFTFLIMQLRIFKSYYFHHIINDTKASTTLASRGAEIIEDLREKQIEHKKKHERNVLRKIKKKMEKIRSKQEKMLRHSGERTHASEIFTGDKPSYSRTPPKTHADATRAGDYYMFDDLDEQIELEIDDEDDDYLATQEVAEKKPKRKTFMEGEESTPPEEAPIESSAKDVSEQEEEKSQEKGLVRKVIDSILVAIVIKLNRTSRNYRYVMRILEKEKKVLKESKGFGLGARTGTGNIWTPFKYVKKMEGNDGEPSTQAPSTSQPHLHDPSKTVEHDNDSDDSLGSQVDLSAITPRKEKGSEDDLPTGRRVEDISDYDEDFTSRDHNIFIELLIAIWYAILSNTDLLCYMAALINQVAAASLLSLTIPLMIFLWGTLSIPRPTKTFWITLIAYTQTVVLIKCVFRFKMIWFNQATDSLTTAKIIGIQFVDGTSGYDLILLLMLFFHRFLLKSQGLWKSEYKSDTVDDGAYILLDEPPKTDELDGVSSQEVKDIAVITKDENTLIIARQNPGEQIAEGEVCVHVSNFIEEPGNYLPEIIKVTSAKYCSPIVTFLQDLLYKARLPTDVYAYMFFCDFINFFVLLFGFSAFDNQRADGGLSTYLDENRVPISFLIMLIMQFVLIIVDRALYLRKAIKNRLGFHLFLVLGVHAWMFFIIPSLQGRVFNSQVPTVIFYLVKCVYFILSSYQLRCGYPTRLSGNFFTKGYSIMNMLAFRIYMLIPLLYELRTLLDWVCTDTTMTLFDWLKMEDIFTEIYLMKCARQMESDLPVERGIKKPILTKAMMGGTLIFVVSFLIWGPFVIFALNSAVGISNVPYDVSLSLRIGPYEPVYEMGAQDSSIHIFDQSMKENFQAAYVRSKEATTFLSDYDYNDVAALVLGTSSASLWSISPPDKERFLEDLEKNRTLTCRFRYTLSRKLFNKDSPATISEETVFELTAEHPGRAGLVEMLQGKSTDVEVKLAALLPKFLKVKSGGKIKPVTQLLPVNLEYRDLTIRFYKDAASDQSWWQVNEFCQDPFYENVLSKLPLANCDTKIVIYTFSDKMFPSILTMLTAGGIIGMYTTVVLVGSRILRSFFAGSSRRVIFEELPYVDRVLQLCLDVYLVREAREFALEEDLYAKLLFLYRSPETMIKWTRPKEDNETDDTASGSAKRKSD
ncbi:piezo-type mechanosensitive ion channel component isoform X6 [Hermetia illucens]|uniref:piezo-type mechanosensitive ion channel component isoform X6 n=1 Tax=Hermetia illucens TaxID=343691 RepID=UPI0018CC27AD|nr:piezo-type mechanosensitive ion channel component isoform X6 [Hermetia illucens]